MKATNSSARRRSKNNFVRRGQPLQPSAHMPMIHQEISSVCASSLAGSLALISPVSRNETLEGGSFGRVDVADCDPGSGSIISQRDFLNWEVSDGQKFLASRRTKAAVLPILFLDLASDMPVLPRMKIEQVNKLKSAHVTFECLGKSDERRQLWSGIPGLVEAYETGIGILERIAECSRVQIARSGEAEAKTDLKKKMLKSAFIVRSSLTALASATKNPQLAAQVDFSATDLGRGTEVDVTNRCQTIWNLGTENSELLISKYNLTANDLKTLKTDIKAFSDARPKPRNSQGESSSATQELVDLFDALDEVLDKQIDCLMVKFEDSEPAFYNEYKASRVVVDASATRDSKDEPGTQGTSMPKAA